MYIFLMCGWFVTNDVLLWKRLGLRRRRANTILYGSHAVFGFRCRMPPSPSGAPKNHYENTGVFFIRGEPSGELEFAALDTFWDSLPRNSALRNHSCQA